MDKHNANLCILEILRKYTDKDHTITQQEILRRLKDEYDLSIDRRSVKSNIDFLIAAGYEIETEGGYRLITRDLEDAELQLLIDSVLFSKYLSANQATELTEKLRSMSSIYFKDRMSHVAGIREMQYVDNQQVLYSIETIGDAIDSNRKIHYTSSHYGTDYERHPGTEHTVSPYQIVANNGRFYLICHDERYSDNAPVYYRIDRMRNVKMLDEAAEKDPDFNPSEYANKVHNMFDDGKEPEDVVLLADNDRMLNIIDRFGDKVETGIADEGHFRVTVNTVPSGTFFSWIFRFRDQIRIEGPAHVKKDYEEMLKTARWTGKRFFAKQILHILSLY